MISLLSISQNSYPKKSIIDQNSVVILDYNSLKKINLVIEREKYQQIEIIKLDSLIQKKNEIIFVNEQKILNLDQQVLKYRELIKNKDFILAQKENLIRLEKRHKRKVVVYSVVSSLAAGFLIGTLIK